jgi:hypothetical protein
MDKLPERINVIKTITYDVPSLVNDLKEMGHEGDITIETLLDYIVDWVEEDFGNFIDLIYQDENGEML